MVSPRSDDARRTRSRVTAVLGVAAVIAFVAVLNSHRAQVQRADRPRPSTVVATPIPVPASDTQCLMPTYTGTAEDANVYYATPGHPHLVVIASRCTDAAGDRLPSFVQVRDLDDDYRVVATVIRTSQLLHVSSITTDALGFDVIASESAWPQDGDQQVAANHAGLFSRRFVPNSDGLSFTADYPQRIANACSPTDLSLRVSTHASPVTGGPGWAVLTVRNIASTPCNLEGFPKVTARTVSGQSLVAATRLNGPHGGLGATATAPAPTLVAPGEVLSAVVDSFDQDQSGGTVLCDTATSLAVTLPTGEQLGTVGSRLRVCDLTVHPFLPGTTGSAL